MNVVLLFILLGLGLNVFHQNFFLPLLPNLFDPPLSLQALNLFDVVEFFQSGACHFGKVEPFNQLKIEILPTVFVLKEQNLLLFFLVLG